VEESHWHPFCLFLAVPFPFFGDGAQAAKPNDAANPFLFLFLFEQSRFFFLRRRSAGLLQGQMTQRSTDPFFIFEQSHFVFSFSGDGAQAAKPNDPTNPAASAAPQRRRPEAAFRLPVV